MRLGDRGLRLACLPFAVLLLAGPATAHPQSLPADLVEEPAAFPIEVTHADGRLERYLVEGVLTRRADLPPAAGVPGVLLLHGSNDGQRLRKDRDATVTGARTLDGKPCKRFLMLAHALARAGCVVYRHHKRGYADRPEDDRLDVVSTITLDRSLDDSRRALARLRQAAPLVDPNRIILLGYSEGTMTAPVLAAEDSGVVGVVLLGCVVDFPRVARFQLVQKPLRDAFEALDLDRNGQLDSSERSVESSPGYEMPGWLFATETLDEDADGLISREEVRAELERVRLMPFRRASEDPSHYWHGHFQWPTNLERLPMLSKPVVLFQGLEDWRTPASHARELERALDASGSRRHTFVYWPGLGHGFSPPRPVAPGGRVRSETAGPPAAAVLEALQRVVRRRFVGESSAW